MNFRCIVLLVVSSLCSLNLQAAGDRWFDVEILVFKRNVDVQKISEQLDQNNVYLKKRDRLEVLQAQPATSCSADTPCLHQQNPVQITDNEMVNGGHRLQRLSSSQLQLKPQLNRLKNHQLFKPLLHVAWRMPVQSRQNALPIHLFAGENYALDIYKEEILAQQKQQAAKALSTPLNSNQETHSIAATKDKLDVLDALQQDNVIRDLYEIDGNFLLYVQRYLEIESQLIVRTETQKEISSSTSVLATPVLATDMSGNNNEAAVEVVNQPVSQQPVRTKTVVTETLFDQTRRLRSGEIHYLDHPLFGIIVQIRKIK